MGCPGGDLLVGVVAEAVEFYEVESALGLCRLKAVHGGVPGWWQHALPGCRIQAAFAQEAGGGDADADEDEGDVHAHEGADQVEGVLVVGPVHP